MVCGVGTDAAVHGAGDRAGAIAHSVRVTAPLNTCDVSEPSPVALAQMPLPAAPETEQESLPVALKQELLSTTSGTEHVCFDRHCGAALRVLGWTLHLLCWCRCWLTHQLSSSQLIARFFASGEHQGQSKSHWLRRRSSCP